MRDGAIGIWRAGLWSLIAVGSLRGAAFDLEQGFVIPSASSLANAAIAASRVGRWAPSFIQHRPASSASRSRFTAGAFGLRVSRLIRGIAAGPQQVAVMLLD
jgi:hypothetical protein